MKPGVIIALVSVLTILGLGDARPQIQVLPECVELARREKFPTDYLSETQWHVAKKRLRWLRLTRWRDPIVHSCVTAIKRTYGDG